VKPCASVKDQLELVVIHVDDLRHPIDRHLPYQGHGKGLKEKGEVRSIPGPWHIDLEHPIVGTVDPWNPHDEITGVLEETEMPPFFLSGVVSFYRFSTVSPCWERRRTSHPGYSSYAFLLP